jgi:hypothetical protein
MKLSFAAALLGQTLPALSKRHGPFTFTALEGGLRLNAEIQKATSPLSSILEHDDERRGLRYNRRMKRKAARYLKNSPNALKTMMVPCDPTSTDADVGILSCGDDYVCEPSDTSSLGGICTAVHVEDQGRESMLRGKVPLINRDLFFSTRGEAMVECDPTSVDIGILACEDGQYCEQDETSELGGFCVDSLTSDKRHLQGNVLDYYMTQCGAYPPAAPYMFCDCTNVNKKKGTGTMVCSQNTTAASLQGCESFFVTNFFTYTFDKKKVVSTTDCFETTAPLPEKICFSYGKEGSGCSAQLNGQACYSCTPNTFYVPTFNCTNVGGRVGDSVKETLAVLDQCANSTCTNFCGAGFTIPPDKFPEYAYGYFNTCGEFAYWMSNKAIPDALCPSYSTSAQVGRCCAPV